MGRKKLQIKLIENKDSRYSTFSKRRSGLIKKAQELSVLCEVDVALLVFSAAGNPYHFCSGDSLDKFLKRYQKYLHDAKEAAVAENKRMDQSEDAWLSCADLLQRPLQDQEIEQLSIDDLSGLQEQLSAALAQVRSTKDWILREENKQLKEKMNMLLLTGNHGSYPQDDDDDAIDLNAIGQEDDDTENSMDHHIEKATLSLLK